MKRWSKDGNTLRMHFLDADLFIFVRADRGSLGKATRSIIASLEEGKIHGAISSLIIDEVVWGLRRELHSFDKAIDFGKKIIRLPNLDVFAVSAESISKALDLMSECGLKPRDAIHAAVMTQNNISDIVTEDSDFSKIIGIRVSGFMRLL